MSNPETPFGPKLTGDGAEFRFWAPKASRVQLILQGPDGVTTRTAMVSMPRAGHGWFVLEAEDVGPGWRYAFRLDSALTVPDPASRYQHAGVHGPSTLIDPASYQWVHNNWQGRPWQETVIYELHVGTFSPEGTFDGVRAKLGHLARLGVTAIELMPVAAFSGDRNWGYDGVLPYATASVYGRPDDLKRLVDEAHGHGIMVFLDVVYNHFGPDGNYLHVYAPDFFSRKDPTPWGPAINFSRQEVRDFVLGNVMHWLEEYRIDGLRFDAVHAIIDRSQRHILDEISDTVLNHFADRRHVHLILENVENTAQYLERGSVGIPERYTAQWNDDIHHALHVLLTGEKDGYYGDYSDRPAYHLGRCLSEGFAYQGEPSAHLGDRPRGQPSDHLPSAAFVSFLQNHDQVGNRAFGERIDHLAPTPGVRAARAIILLAPQIPMLFMGEEWGALEPFLFFCDFHDELGRAVRDGRRSEFRRFEAFAHGGAESTIPDPNQRDTFKASVLNWDLAEPSRRFLEETRSLLEIRAREIQPRLDVLSGRGANFDVLPPAGVAVTWTDGGDRVLRLLANMSSRDCQIDAARHAPQSERLIYATHGDTEALADLKAGRLKPWSVLWFVG